MSDTPREDDVWVLVRGNSELIDAQFGEPHGPTELAKGGTSWHYVRYPHFAKLERDLAALTVAREAELGVCQVHCELLAAMQQRVKAAEQDAHSLRQGQANALANLAAMQEKLAALQDDFFALAPKYSVDLDRLREELAAMTAERDEARKTANDNFLSAIAAQGRAEAAKEEVERLKEKARMSQSDLTAKTNQYVLAAEERYRLRENLAAMQGRVRELEGQLVELEGADRWQERWFHEQLKRDRRDRLDRAFHEAKARAHAVNGYYKYPPDEIAMRNALSALAAVDAQLAKEGE